MYSDVTHNDKGSAKLNYSTDDMILKKSISHAKKGEHEGLPKHSVHTERGEKIYPLQPYGRIFLTRSVKMGKAARGLFLLLFRMY